MKFLVALYVLFLSGCQLSVGCSVNSNEDTSVGDAGSTAVSDSVDAAVDTEAGEADANFCPVAAEDDS